jgi:methyl-accepting chemotaxis protein
VRLPHFSIATKLYAVFALLATVTVALAVVAVLNARRHAALTGEFESAFAGALSVERVKALFDAVEMESRGITMAPDAAGAKAFAAGLIRSNDRIGDVVTEWVRQPQAGAIQPVQVRPK